MPALESADTYRRRRPCVNSASPRSPPRACRPPSVGTDEAGRDRRRRGRGRRLGPDGADDPGRGPEEQPHEAADRGVAQGRRLRGGSAHLHEDQHGRREQGAARLFADLHAATLRQDPFNWRELADLGRRPGRVRPLDQHDAALQDHEGIHRRGEEGRPAVQDGRHRLQARGPRAHRLRREEDRGQVRLPALQVG